MEKASAWLEDQRRKHRTVVVTYLPGETLSLEVPATIGRTVFRVDDDYGRVERTVSRDFLIEASDLAHGGHVRLPRRGDEIRETRDGRVYTYEVMSPGKEPEWRWSDPYKRTLRIHTKQTGVEDASP